MASCCEIHRAAHTVTLAPSRCTDSLSVERTIAAVLDRSRRLTPREEPAEMAKEGPVAASGSIGHLNWNRSVGD